LASLAELLNAGDLKRCGCAEAVLQKFFTDPTVLIRAQSRRPSSDSLRSTPQESRPQVIEKCGASIEKARRNEPCDGEEEAVQSTQPISWEFLPPLALPSPTSADVETSLWCARPVDTTVLVPDGITSALPFSTFLRQAFDNVAWEASSERGADASGRAALGYKRPPLACAPPALEVPQTQLARIKNRKLSAAELWLGPEPSD